MHYVWASFSLELAWNENSTPSVSYRLITSYDKWNSNSFYVLPEKSTLKSWQKMRLKISLKLILKLSAATHISNSARVQPPSVHLRPVGSGWRRRRTRWPVLAGSWCWRLGGWQPGEWTAQLLSEGGWTEDRNQTQYRTFSQTVFMVFYLCNHKKTRCQLFLFDDQLKRLNVVVCLWLAKQTWQRHHFKLRRPAENKAENVWLVQSW